MNGILQIELVDTQGKVLERRVTHNLVVTDGYDELIKVLAGESATQHYVNRMQFGTGTIAPGAGDTILSMPISPIKNVTPTYPNGGPYRVIFEAFLLSAEGNGFPISEAGLLTPSGGLVARAVFASVSKTTNDVLHATWQINS